MTRRDKNRPNPVPDSEHTNESTKAIIGEVPSREVPPGSDAELEDYDDDDDGFDEANQPTGDPAKNVPSA
jgi:hypothetical protein